jgi:Cytochrome P460
MALGVMPLRDYEFVLPVSKISFADLEMVKKYLATTIYLKPDDSAKSVQPTISTKFGNILVSNREIFLNQLTELLICPIIKNGPRSSTERFDNGTMRIIYGNAVAVRAVKENRISPWPNGSTFAKVLWTQLEDNDGNVRTGAFLQVDYMVKDDNKYKSTRGWGYPRIKTAMLIPYGKTLLFATECVNCHRAVEKQDYVFTSPIK